MRYRGWAGADQGLLCAAHVILELAEREKGAQAGAGLRVREGLPENSPQLKPPVFDLIGVLIGNGLTDPLSQVAPPLPLASVPAAAPVGPLLLGVPGPVPWGPRGTHDV